MFTGLIETKGIVKSVIEHADSTTLTLYAPSILDDVTTGDSIAVNGCCLTVEQCTHEHFSVTVVKESLSKTTLGKLGAGSHVNLERAMKLGQRLGGHLVSGHVDTTGAITNIVHNDSGMEIWIAYPNKYRRNLIPVGSICVDGISLTVAALTDPTSVDAQFKVALIPHTIEATTIGQVAVGDTVNLEFDLVGKYALQAGGFGE